MFRSPVGWTHSQNSARPYLRRRAAGTVYTQFGLVEVCRQTEQTISVMK